MLEQKLQKIYEEVGADALFVQTDFLRKYVTGFSSSDGFVIINERDCYFVADLRYFEAAQRALKNSSVQVVEGSLKRALELVEGLSTLGVPFPFCDLSMAQTLESKGFKLLDCMPSFKRVMEVKSEQEIAYIQRACEIAEDALLELLPELKEGMSERETAALLEYYMKKTGASGTSFDTIVAFGENSSVPHHETGDRKLRFGDIVLIDFGCKVEGYCSDITRTFLFGDDGKHGEFKRAYQEVLKAHERVKSCAHAGMTGKEVDEIARNCLREAGLSHLFTHSLGHGIGLQIHEYPAISPKSEEILQDGMVFSDEPGVYLAGKYGIRIEDSVYLKNGKVCSFMKKTERNLVIL